MINIKQICQKEIAFNTEMQWMQLVRVKNDKKFTCRVILGKK